MGWSDWPYWLKGGIIGVTYAVILTIYFFYSPFRLSSIPIIGFLFTIISYIFNFPFILILGLSFYGFSFLVLFGVSGLAPDIYFHLEIMITSSILYFIIGSIIGLIYGKIKSRKNTPPVQTNSLRT